MIKIEIKTAAVEEFSGISKKSGKPFTMRNQTGYANVVDRTGELLRQAVKITLEDGQQPYAPGFYQLAPNSIYVDSFSRLIIGRVVLIPVQSAMRSAA